MTPRWKLAGFTLIEVVIVVVLVGILVGIAMPSYKDYVVKSRRVEAKELLWITAQRLQQYYTMNNRYITTASTLGLQTTSTNGYYTLTIAAGSTGSINTSYSISAAPVSGSSQASDSDCGTFTLNSLGQKTVSGSQTTPPCW